MPPNGGTENSDRCIADGPCAERAWRVDGDNTTLFPLMHADVIVALGGDGFMLETLHRFRRSWRADFRHASGQCRLSDEPF